MIRQKTHQKSPKEKEAQTTYPDLSTSICSMYLYELMEHLM